MSGSALTLNVGLSFHTWKAAFQHINNGLINKEHLISHSKKPSKSCHTNCKWSVNLSRPIKNNPGPLIFVTTFFNEHSSHNLDVFAYNFKESKAFMKSMLKDIEWMSIYTWSFKSIVNQACVGNPIIRHPKGRPPGTARFKGPLQTSTQSNEAPTSRNVAYAVRMVIIALLVQ
ncbi:hypothetical protein RhiirA5_425299 [Rhizophagus irregularis]|uniref:Uncharacterized protein n=1 Tax=Rhizophagus irregularis TaxID=588596 RepID=A0A2N0P6E7_9GLOM|nr:hypothetical protein RhiirA5_425299 [Rhizophagus irregularis]